MTSSTSALAFDKNRHVRYFAYCLNQLPEPYVKLDTNRLTLVHFATHALDLLGVWDDEALQEKLRLNKTKVIEWIYQLQVLSNDSSTKFSGGFLGGSFLGPDNTNYHHGHVAMVYTALCTLRTLGDDLSRIDKPTIIHLLQSLQRNDGSYQCVQFGSEHDNRFVYCACAISYMLNDWSGVNIDNATKYIQSCVSFDGAIALIPGQEGHGGSTFCGVAALVLMDKLDTVFNKQARASLIHWCVHRQVGGMQGRPNKLEDTCYSYWIGGTLTLLGYGHLLHQTKLRNYILTCQSPLGGFGKVIGAFPDVLHSFYSLAWLSISSNSASCNNNNEEEPLEPLPLNALNCTLGIRQERAELFGGSFP